VNPFRLSVSIIMLLVGLVWIGQGTGLLGGSPMSSQSFWAVAGAVLVVAAVGVAWTARRDRRSAHE
jgi:hypothetical protein